MNITDSNALISFLQKNGVIGSSWIPQGSDSANVSGVPQNIPAQALPEKNITDQSLPLSPSSSVKALPTDSSSSIDDMPLPLSPPKDVSKIGVSTEPKIPTPSTDNGLKEKN